MADGNFSRHGVRLLKGVCALAPLLAGMHAGAAEYQLSGFASLVGGRTEGHCVTNTIVAAAYQPYCTRYVADWAHAGVYHPAFSWSPESKLGLQGTAQLSEVFSATSQVVGRALDDGSASVEWAYFTYKPSPAWTLQFGRKRLPLSHFSDVQDVGYAYHWVRPPPEIYGWDAVNYNGVNATYRGAVGAWSLKSNLFLGDETSRKNQYSKLFYSEPKDVQWQHIAGADFELTRDWFTTRLFYVRSDYRQFDRDTRSFDLLYSGRTQGKQAFYGVSATADLDAWVVRAEYSLFDRNKFAYKADSAMVALGYRIGDFTPMVTLSGYRESTNFPDQYTPMRWSGRSFVLRYEATKSSALKVQLDDVHDLNHEIPFAGSAKVLSLSYDIVF